MINPPVHLQIHAHRFDRLGSQPRAEGEILYSFYVDGRLLGKTTADVGTRRALLGRLYDVTGRLVITGWTPELTTELARLGRQVYTIFFPQEVQRSVFQDDANRIVILEVQDHDVPWELISDDNGFISKRIAFGRHLPRPKSTIPRSTRKRIEIAVVGDPTGDLPDARTEATVIAQRCEQALASLKKRFAISGDVRLLIGSDATKEAVLFDLLMEPARQLDLMHYAGHAKHDARDPSNTSLPLADGDLRGFEARTLASSPIVFVNGCRAAAGDVSDTVSFGSVSGLAAEFLAGGARSYIAPLWPVTDSEARRFADVFYERVMSGDSVGEALLSARVGGSTPDALAYVLFGDPTDALQIFHPRLTVGPYVNDIGIERIIQLEREYSGLELLAVNDLPWILWDEMDINDWIHNIPIDPERASRAKQALNQYISEFTSRIQSGDKTLIAIVNESVVRRYLAIRGSQRATELLKVFRSLKGLSTFCMIFLDYEEGDIEEIELISKHANVPPDPRDSVYVFNKQTRFEDSERTYSLYEDYNPDMIRQYIERYLRSLRRAIAAYETRFGTKLEFLDIPNINTCTESVIAEMIMNIFKGRAT